MELDRAIQHQIGAIGPLTRFVERVARKRLEEREQRRERGAERPAWIHETRALLCEQSGSRAAAELAEQQSTARA